MLIPPQIDCLEKKLGIKRELPFEFDGMTGVLTYELKENKMNSSQLVEGFGFYPVIIKKESPLTRKVVFRKNMFGYGLELTLLYTTTRHSSFLSTELPENLVSTMYKVIGEKRELLFQFTGLISNSALTELIKNSI